MIRICHFTVAHRAKDTRIFEKECKSLSNNGYDVSLVVSNIDDTILSGIKIYGVRTSSNPVYRLLFGARKVYKKAKKLDADIYHFHDIELYFYGLKLINKGKIVIFDSHEDWPTYVCDIAWIPRPLKKIVSLCLNSIYKNTISKFNAVITVSPHIVDNLKKFTDKVYLIPNYPIFNAKSKNFESFDNFNKRKNKFIYSGTVYNGSNQEAIISALQNIEDAEYQIVGVLTNALKVALKDLDKAHKVDFVPFVPKDKLDTLYHSSICGLVIFDYSPNVGYKKGTIGNNKIFEYMVAGLPIICTNFDYWRDMIIDKYKCGICVQPESITEIKEAMQYIIDNKEASYQMGQNGLNAVINEFNWEKQEEILLELYHNLVNDGVNSIIE